MLDYLIDLREIEILDLLIKEKEESIRQKEENMPSNSEDYNFFDGFWEKYHLRTKVIYFQGGPNEDCKKNVVSQVMKLSKSKLIEDLTRFTSSPIALKYAEEHYKKVEYTDKQRNADSLIRFIIDWHALEKKLEQDKKLSIFFTPSRKQQIFSYC